MMRARAVYRALLHCYPAAFRHEYGNQMFLMFAEQLRKAGPFERLILWARAALDVLVVAPREHCHVILQDLRYALRMMAARRSFTAVAILSLAIGIGANTAIFSLWNGVLHSSLPGVEKPDQLVILSDPSRSGGWTGNWEGRTDGPRAWLSYGEFEQLRDHAGSFSALMASQAGLSTWQIRFDNGAWEEARGRLVSGGFFQVLGARPAIGRLFTTEGDRADAPLAVISYSYWQRRFGGSPDVLGKTFVLRKSAMTIVGVAAAGFIGETSGQQPDVWLPLRLQPTVSADRDRLHDTPPQKTMWLHVFGRLKPSVTLAQADAQTNALFHAGLESFYGVFAQRHPEFLDQQLRLQSAARGASPIRTEFSNSLSALLAAVALLLLIACANLANLLLAHGAARKSEIALRLSLGANRGRLVRQFVTESLTLAGIAGVAAIAVAYGLHGVLVKMIAESDERFVMTFALDPAVLVFIAASTLATALLFGVLPALQVTKTDIESGLKERSRSAVSRGQMRSGRILVVIQIALSLPLLVGAGLLARTVYNLQRANLGFSAEHLLLARVDLRDTKDSTRRDSMRRTLLNELQRIPGVRAASFSQLGVFSGGNSATTVDVEGYASNDGGKGDSAYDVVGPGYFSALGTPLLLGRDIVETDGSASKVCVINEAFAKRFFEHRNPIGLHVSTLDANDERTTYQVVGVAKDARTQDLRDQIYPRFFVPASSAAPHSDSPTFFIRTAATGAPTAAALRKTIQEVDPAVPVLYTESIAERIAPLTAQERTTARIVVVFGSVALALAAIGLYGVLSYGVARRTGEIAIRMAVGAKPGRVISMILGETLGVVIAGLALGGGLAYAASRFIHSRLYGVEPQDPLTFALATTLLVCVALSAAYLPALRASKLDPMAALRRE